jgi:hypothetical protein
MKICIGCLEKQYHSKSEELMKISSGYVDEYYYNKSVMMHYYYKSEQLKLQLKLSLIS